MHGMGRGQAFDAQRRVKCARLRDNERDGELPLLIVVEDAYHPV
jgi:hypothetical protein